MIRRAAPLLCTLALVACSTGSEDLADPMSMNGVPADAAMSGDERQTMFRLTKNENSNYVCYDVVLDGPNRLAEKPLDDYWIMTATHGGREEMTGRERGVYGATVDAVDREAGRFSFTLNGFDGKRIEVELPAEGEALSPRTTINGKSAVLQKIHLLITKTWNPLSPRVEAHLIGTAVPNGGEVTEVIKN